MRARFIAKLFAIMAIILLLQHNIYAETSGDTKQHPREQADNVIGVFLGGTHVEHSTFWTYGLEYHRVVAFPFGVSIVGEAARDPAVKLNELDVFVLGSLNIGENIAFSIGPGIKHITGFADRSVARFNATYILLLPDKIELAPNINLDIFNLEDRNIHAWVFGVRLGKQF